MLSVVMGIDQSLRSTGVFWMGPGLLGWQQITPKSLRGAVRLLFIRDAIMKAVLEIKPTLVAIEGYSYGSVGKIAELGELGGVLRVALEEKKIPTIVVAPTQTKKFATGNHQADKRDVIAAMNSRLEMSWTLKHNDLADAASLAYIAHGYLNPQTVTLRHEAEVITAIKKAASPVDKKPRPNRRHKFHRM